MDLEQLPTMQGMCHADEHLRSYVIMSSNAYVDMTYFLSTSQENKIDIFLLKNVFETKLALQLYKLGEKGNFLEVGSKLCVWTLGRSFNVLTM